MPKITVRISDNRCETIEDLVADEESKYDNQSEVIRAALTELLGEEDIEPSELLSDSRLAVANMD